MERIDVVFKPRFQGFWESLKNIIERIMMRGIKERMKKIYRKDKRQKKEFLLFFLYLNLYLPIWQSYVLFDMGGINLINQGVSTRIYCVYIEVLSMKLGGGHMPLTDKTGRKNCAISMIR